MLLADLIRQAGMTQAYVAGQLGMNPSWFNRICLGLADLRVSKLAALAEALRMPVEDVARALTETMKGPPDGAPRTIDNGTHERSHDG